MIREYGYEYDAALDPEIWESTKGKTTDKKLFDALCLRSGRDALKAIARQYKPCTVWLPALACDSMVLPFRQYGHQIRFYRLDPDYAVDRSSLAFGKEKELFLYMNYFGKKALTSEELHELKKEHRDLVFIEDCTHDLIWRAFTGFQPDYRVASLRKWLPIPDGGLLWGKVHGSFSKDTTFSETRLKAQNMRREFLQTGEAELKTEFRKIFSTVSDIMDNDPEPAAMSAYAYALAGRTDWSTVRTARKTNAETLIEILRGSEHIRFIQDEPGKSDLYVAFTVPNRDEVQKRLSAEGIFNTIIWPLSEEQKAICETAGFTEENMLAAPCDQRYTKEDMETIGREIVKVVNDVNG